ncbi:CoA transferase, partial [Thermodesulfobacteriota bacterium]
IFFSSQSTVSFNWQNPWMKEDGIDSPLCQVEDWDAFNVAELTKEEVKEIDASLLAFFKLHTKQELSQISGPRDIEACPVYNPAEVLADEHMTARNYWTELDDPQVDAPLIVPRQFFLSSETENFVTKRAPLPGEDNDDIYINELGLSFSDVNALKEKGVI